MLELVFVNRVIDKNSANILSKLLSFDGHPRDKKGSKYSKSSSNESSGPTLYDCLEFFRKPEKLDKDNSWYCNVCKDHVEATKTIEIYKTPAVLILCFQRFKSHNIYFKDKLEDKVFYPVQNLDMNPFVLSIKDGQNNDTPLKYDLYAVSNHYGSLAFGHYTAYCKNPETGQWYDFNDSSVTTISSS
jgi:ubiquitin carboxyl-terminal hydrolase 4/11